MLLLFLLSFFISQSLSQNATTHKIIKYELIHKELIFQQQWDLSNTGNDNFQLYYENYTISFLHGKLNNNNNGNNFKFHAKNRSWQQPHDGITPH